MTEYEEFAEAYSKGEYTRHSEKMAEIFPQLQDEYGLNPDSVLDLACGDGTFLRKLPGDYNRLKGIDISEEFIEIAREKSEPEISFEVADMRHLTESGFDVVTCWYDSLNYLKSLQELKEAFKNMNNALNGEGYFIFDMNTEYWLSEGWPDRGTYVARDTSEFFEVHRPDYDEDSRVFRLKITGFKREGDSWAKFEEIHEEKAFRIEEVKTALRETGFKILDVYGDLESRKKVEDEDPRVWFVTRRTGEA